ncbi:NAD(P)/FAD-dependent oxidoreductase [Clostridium neuense]|uniref:NAD(P)/FAD-dependent oxidoreductase n=1 Tax=Clostridium neuense TaxID=1728934 RepID=A0ABW8TFQ4_9CLOT
MDYDVLILGGGIVGCSIAYELSKYSLNVSIIEKELDIGNDVSETNASLIFDGMEIDNDLNYYMEYYGNRNMRDITRNFNVPFKRFKSVIFEENSIENKNFIEKMYARSIRRGIKGIQKVSGNNLKFGLDTKINFNKAIISKNWGVICPYDLSIAYGEIAFDNGVNFRLGEKVVEIKKISKGFKVTTTKNKFTCKFVINTIPDDDYKLGSKIKKNSHKNNNAKCFLINKKFKFKDIAVILGEDEERIFIYPNFNGETVAYVITKNEISYEEAFEKLQNRFPAINHNYINNSYNKQFFNDRIIIDDKLISKGYIKIDGKNYGTVTMTQFIANTIRKMVIENIPSKLKKDFYGKRREIYRFRDMTNEERKNLININPKYGKIICLCNQVTEGEIIDSIRRPLGARTIDGIRKRTGVMKGDCCGSYCMSKVISILANETNKDITEILEKSDGSNMIMSRIKQFNEI